MKKGLLLIIVFIAIFCMAQKIIDEKTLVKIPVSYKLDAGKLLVSYGEVQKVNDSTTVTKYEEATAIDKSNDSVNIVWVSDSKYEIIPKDQKLAMYYIGVYAKELRKAFYVGDLINLKTGERNKSFSIINDDGTYEVLIPAGWKLDPGYAAIPVGVGLGTFSPDSLPSPYWVNSEHAYYFNDTSSGGFVTDSGTLANANAQLLNGIKLVGGFNSAYLTTAKACSLDGINDTALIASNMTTFDSTASWTTSFRIKFLSTTTTGSIMGSKVLGSPTGYYHYWAYSGTDSTLALWKRVDGGTAVSAKIKLLNPQNWNRITVVFDSTQATSALRLPIMLNGVAQTVTYSTTWPTKTNNFGGRFYIGEIAGQGAGAKILLDDIRITSGIRAANIRRTNLMSLTETVRSDSIKSNVVNTANIKLWLAGQQIDTVWLYKNTGDSLRFLTGTADSTVNVFSLFNKDTVSTGTWKKIRSKGGVADTINCLASNNIGRATINTSYHIFMMDSVISHNRYWVAVAANGRWNNTANWSTVSGGSGGADVPTIQDTVFLNAASAVPCTLDVAAFTYSINTTGYAGTFVQAGFPINTTFSQNWGGGNLIFSGRDTLIGDGGKFTIGASAGTITATSCSLYVLGTDSIYINKNFSLKSAFYAYPTKTVTFVGTADLISGDLGRHNIMGGTCTFLMTGASAANRGISCQPVTNDTPITIIAGSTINGSAGQISFNSSTGLQHNFYIPAITTASGSRVKMYVAKSGSGQQNYYQTGYWNLAGNLCFCNGAAGNSESLFVNQGFKCDTLYTGSVTTGAVVSYFDFNGGACTTNVRIATDSGTQVINYGTSTWQLLGDVYLNKNATTTAGTSTFTFAANAKLTSYGRILNALNVTAGTLTPQDSVTAASLTITGAGAIAQNTKSIRLSGAFSQTGTGASTLNSWVTQTGDANFTYTSSGAITSVACSVSTQGTATINLGQKQRTFGRWIFGNGKTYTFTAGDSLKISTITASDISGTAGNIVTWNSSTTGSQFYFNPNTALTVSYINVKDCYNYYPTKIIAYDGTNVNTGNNTNWLFSSTTGHKGVNNSLIYRNHIYNQNTVRNSNETDLE